MSDYIDRQAAIDAAIKADMENNSNILSEKRARVIDGHISAVPPAQPKIIRCKDCRFNDGVAYCEMHYMDVNGNDFCSWAEIDQRRKEKK